MDVYLRVRFIYCCSESLVFHMLAGIMEERQTKNGNRCQLFQRERAEKIKDRKTSLSGNSYALIFALLSWSSSDQQTIEVQKTTLKWWAWPSLVPLKKKKSLVYLNQGCIASGSKLFKERGNGSSLRASEKEYCHSSRNSGTGSIFRRLRHIPCSLSLT